MVLQSRAVPRYTSYPTTPHFSETITSKTYESWLAALDSTVEASIYLHIPYCSSLCWFCGCYTKVIRQAPPIKSYLATLANEISSVSQKLNRPVSVNHIHFGGGSPNLLKSEDWETLMAHLKSKFHIVENASIAVELDPRNITKEYVSALSSIGVNRVSLGVQDLNQRVQIAINRIQSVEQVTRVVKWLKGNHIQNINIDLMYGLPHQTVKLVLDTVDKVVSLDPQRVTLFGYAHVPWMRHHQRMIPEETLPDIVEREKQAIVAAERLVREGFIKIGLDHFAKPDDNLSIALTEKRLRRNFQGYTDDISPILFGFGASAISQLPFGYAQNLSSIRQYTDVVHRGRLPITKGHALTSDDRIRADIIENLMCYLTADLNGDNQLIMGAQKKLKNLVDNGMCRLDEERIEVPESSRHLVRLVAAAFDDYLEGGKGRHTSAL